MPQTIQPHQLAQALEGRRGVTVLSLDCFDTLLWRDTHAPGDLFTLLGEVTPEQRVRAEQAARKARVLDRAGSGEVTLREIYVALLPQADAATIEEHVERELAVEAAHCHAFAPTVGLMRAAKRRGLRVIVVSDTYLERDQLAGLIRAAAGDAVADLIDAIFCSCEYRRAKSEGLFAAVLAKTATRPDRVLHVGDNPRSDAAAAERHGLQALHLVQFGEATVQRLRQETVAGALMMPGSTPFQPHRAALALGEPQLADPAEALGFGVLGPVMTTFAHWIVHEARTLAAARGGRVHPLFLMRDGFLPRETVGVVVPDLTTHAVEVSRFAATAASLTDPAAIRRFVRDEIGDGAGTDFLRQLLIVGDEAAALLATLPEEDGALALADMLREDAWTQTIMARGQAYADRLVRYVRTIVDPAPGDTVMLVDLGYNGSVQNRLAPLLTKALGVEVVGRYLLLAEREPSGLDKRGMIDRRHHDPETLRTFMGAIAILEQFCTTSDGSVVDYAQDGTPLRAPLGIKGRQSMTRDRIQAGCLAYAGSDGAAVVRANAPIDTELAGRAAAATLARLLFLPSPQETALLDRFEHDQNLGGDDTIALFDPQMAASGLRERGLFYLKDADRLYLPAELRGQGLPISLALLAQRRFGLDLSYADFCDSAITVPVLMADGTDTFADTVQAMPTHDGYYVAAVPIGAGRYTVGLQFGRGHEWVQIESARFLPVAAFLAGHARAAALTHDAIPSCEGMTQIAPHLFHCEGPEAFLMVPPPAVADARTPMMLAVVFRPIAARELTSGAGDIAIPATKAHA